MPKLQVKALPVTTQNRFAIVQNGTADIMCGATTHTTEREKLSAFSHTIFVAGSRLMTRKDSGIKDFDNLVGKTVVTFARSTSEKMLRKMNSEQNYRINIVSTFDRGDTPLSVLQAGQADAYMMDDVLNPPMKTAMAVGSAAAGITVVEVDLEFLLDGISQIKVGTNG
jgi:glutamate/aspartate transport system substrate-binding protein